MATYVLPQVRVFQELETQPTGSTAALRAHISGPNGKLHRFSVEDEKALINVGLYDKDLARAIAWPDRTAGSKVDTDSVKVFIENALLLYYADLLGDSSNGRGTITNVSGRKNWVRSSTISFKDNGTDNPRSGLLLDRDVQIDDVVLLRGVTSPDDDCVEEELWTTVTGFAAEEGDGEVLSAWEESNNKQSTDAAVSITQTGGAVNCVVPTADGSDYDGLADGYPTETYTITVIKSSVSGCQAARLRVTSDSGTDDVDEVTPEDFGDATAIGTRGLTVTFSNTPGTCSLSASSAGADVAELVVGQEWTVTVSQSFERVCCEANSTYSGPDDDTYIVTVTKGGTWAQLPQITVTTAKGLDSSGPTTVTGDNTAVPVGTYGLTISFVDCFGSDADSAGSEGESLGGDSQVAGLCLGDRFYITVATGQNGPIQTLILRDDLPLALQQASDLDIRLFIRKDIEVTEHRLSSPPLVNYTIESTQVVVNNGITAYDSSWTDSGVEQPMIVWDGVTHSGSNIVDYGVLYIEYCEWLTELAAQVNFLDDVADIDAIPGQLDPLNPLKWGVYKALSNSNGQRVGYTAVVDPTSLDSWQDVITAVDGRDDLYNFVPLSHSKDVLDLFQSHADSESSPEAGNWKATFFNLSMKTEKKLVGLSSANDQALHPTSTDNKVVLATLEDNPQASATQYTLLSVPGNNAAFITYGVKAGDIARFLFTIDGFSETTYQEFVVDSVLSQNSLLLLVGHTAPITVPQKLEIWRNLSKDEIAADLKEQAQAFVDRRVVATFPHIAGNAGVSQAGYFVAAAAAGLVSGVPSHQGLTNVELKGFDDLSTYTRDFFSGSQLDEMASAGIWIFTEDRDGTPHTRHALTTDMSDLKHQEEMIRRNLDSLSYEAQARLRPFIGRANATPAMLQRLEYEINQLIKFWKTDGFTTMLGARIIDGAIATDSKGVKQLYIHPLAADRVVIVLRLTLPAPLNDIDLHLVV